MFVGGMLGARLPTSEAMGGLALSNHMEKRRKGSRIPVSFHSHSCYVCVPRGHHACGCALLLFLIWLASLRVTVTIIAVERTPF